MTIPKIFTNFNGFILLSSIILFTFCSSPVESENSNQTESELDKVLMNYELEELSPEEIKGLLFMREEEKLARDVYSYLHEKWNHKIFANISESEQRHTDAVKTLIERYGLEDPVIDDERGIFNDQGLQDLYNSLIEQGSISLLDALKIGATIEEIDIIDLQNQINDVADNQDIIYVYNNLMRGSRNHLRAFMKNIISQAGKYSPQYLTQEKFDEIVSNEMESGGKGRRNRNGRRGY